MQEPYFSSPIALRSDDIPIRSDLFGKGYFGASRNGGRTHKGIDILAPLNTPVLASKSGRVTSAEWDKGYGFFVEIAHPDGLFTRYAHLSRLHVVKGDWVGLHTPIGLVGKTGNASHKKILPHVHFEIRSSIDALNPFRGLLRPSLKAL